MRSIILVLSFSFCLYGQQASPLHIELGYPSGEGQLEWLTQQDPSRSSSAIRVVNSSPNANMDGAWCILMVRVHSDSEVPGTPTWLQSSGLSETGFPASAVLNSTILGMLDQNSQAKAPTRQIMTDPVMCQLYHGFSFFDPIAIAGFGVFGTAADGNAVAWNTMAPYWSSGLAFHVWAKTYQETVGGIDVMNHWRLAEAAMETQALSNAIVRDYLQSPAYAQLIEDDTLYLELQFCVIRCPDPYSPAMDLPWYAFLPQAPMLAMQDISLDYSIPMQLRLPLGLPRFNPSGNVITSQPGVRIDGDLADSPIFFFVGNAMPVDSAVFPLAAGGTITQPLALVDAGFPELGVYSTVLPVDAALLDPLLPIRVVHSAGQPPAPNVVLDELAVISEMAW